MIDSKKYLQQIQLYDSHITTKLEELQHLKGMVLRITPTLKDDVVSGGGTQDKLAEAVAKIVDLEAELAPVQTTETNPSLHGGYRIRQSLSRKTRSHL